MGSAMNEDCSETRSSLAGCAGDSSRNSTEISRDSLDTDRVEMLVDRVLAEIRTVLKSVDESSTTGLVQAVLHANRIVVYGAGRVGIVCSAFAMRLAQMGFCAHMLWEPTTPAIGEADILLLCSGSGETQTVYDVAVLAKQHGVRVVLITSRPESRIGRIADVVVPLSAPTKLASCQQRPSIQPMTTVAEQSLMIYLDVVVLLLMKATHQTSDDLWRRHRNLE
jgi:6-phospho-3-hexuloisomerase